MNTCFEIELIAYSPQIIYTCLNCGEVEKRLTAEKRKRQVFKRPSVHLFFVMADQPINSRSHSLRRHISGAVFLIAVFTLEVAFISYKNISRFWFHFNPHNHIHYNIVLGKCKYRYKCMCMYKYRCIRTHSKLYVYEPPNFPSEFLIAHEPTL